MRNYHLELKTYFETGNAILPHCLKVMPLEPKKKFQKFSIGSGNQLQYYEFKKGELVQDFKSEQQSKEVSRIVISGDASKFSIFFTSGQQIKGMTKKGKEFFKLETSHTETIKSLHVQSQNLWSAGEYILNCYESVNNKIVDKYFFICDDKINDMIVTSVSGQLVLNPVIACQDKTIKVLVDDDKILYQQKFDSACTAICLSPEQTHRYCPIVGYGLKNGGIGCVELTRDEPIVMWSLEGSQTNGSAAAIIKTCDLFQEAQLGYYNLIVARDDGSVEVYSYEHKSPVPTLRFETKLNESITAIDVGYISNAQRQEIIITTYSGKIISLQEKISEKMQAALHSQVNDKIAKQSMQQAKVEKQDKISVLQKEVELLKKKARELEILQEQELDDDQDDNRNNGRMNNGHNDELSQLDQQNAIVDYGEAFKVSYKMNLIPQEASYSLFIDSQLPIDTILLQSMQNIDILSTKDNTCVINKIEDKVNNNVLLATLKIQGEEVKHSRVEIKIRTSEGQNGHLNAIIMPKPSTGNKTAQFLDIPLKPLNLHEKIDQIEEETLSIIPFSEIKITGKFSLTEAHNWISNCLPDVPPNVSSEEQDKTHIMFFKSAFVGTHIILELTKGLIVIRSDNLSAITIIKDQLTTDATTKKIPIDIESNIEQQSVYRTLELLHPLIQEQYTIAQKHQLIDGLKELQLQEEDNSFLSEEYKEILRNADQIKTQFKLQPRKLTFLWGIIADLYMDTAKIKGHHNVGGRITTLKAILNQYNYEELVQFFKTSL